MGFSSLIDILASSVIGGSLLLILFRVHDTTIKNTYVYAGDLTVQQNLVSLVEVLEYDFKKIGYCYDWEEIPDPTKSIIKADSTEIKFLTDVDTDGKVDTMHYYLGPTSELSNTENPRDRVLYRVVNSATPAKVNLGVTEFKLKYYNSLGTELPSPVANPSEIYQMQIDLSVENIAAYEKEYSYAVWKQIRLAARNLRNR